MEILNTFKKARDLQNIAEQFPVMKFRRQFEKLFILL